MAKVQNSFANTVSSTFVSPFEFSEAVCSYWSNLSENWWRMVFAPAYHHLHEGHAQLEVPDPIEEEGEHDLFA
jgi:hypothetical protein